MLADLFLVSWQGKPRMTRFPYTVKVVHMDRRPKNLSSTTIFDFSDTLGCPGLNQYQRALLYIFAWMENNSPLVTLKYDYIVQTILKYLVY